MKIKERTISERTMKSTDTLNGSRMGLPLIIGLIAVMVYNLSLKLIMYGNGDLFKHVQFAQMMFDGKLKSPNPGYYYVWGLFNKIFGIAPEVSAAYSEAFFAVLCTVSIYFVTKLFLKNKISEWGICAVTLFMELFGPIYLPSFSQRYYLGQGTFNTWHNPTNNSVKFITVIIMFLFLYEFNLESDKKITVLGIKCTYKKFMNFLSGFLLFISVFFKPSFFQVFAPTVAIVYLIDFIKNKENIIYYIKKGIVFVPAALVVLYQMNFLFLGEGKTRGGIEIAFLDVWSHYSPCVPVSLVITIAFPIFVYIICKREISKDSYYLPIWIFFLMGVTEYALIVEMSGRYSGNFSWGYNLAIGILFLYSIFKFVDYCIKNENNQKISVKASVFIGYTLLSLHFFWGVWYYWQLMIRPGVQCF